VSTALLVDTGFASLPLVLALESRDICVHVVGLKGAVGLASRVQKYHQIDYSDTSALEKLVREVRPDYLIPGCTDVSYLSCAVIAEKFGFSGFDNHTCALEIQDKSRLRKNMIAAGLCVPKLSLPPYESLNFPVIVKPVDSYSGNGISILHSKNDEVFERAKDCARLFSGSGSFIVESFVVGQLVSHSAFISGGEIKRDFWVNEYCSASPFSVDTSYVTRDEHEEIYSSFREGIQCFAKHLGLVDGLLHTQFIRVDDSCFVIESTRRCPGDLYSNLIALATGFEYAAAYLAPFTRGEVSPDGSAIADRRDIVRHTVSSSGSYSYFGVEFCEPINLVNWVSTARTGDVLAGGSSGRAAVFFAEARSLEEREHIVSLAISRKLYRLQSGPRGMNDVERSSILAIQLGGGPQVLTSVSGGPIGGATVGSSQDPRVITERTGAKT
jgi:hypothetical protein